MPGYRLSVVAGLAGVLIIANAAPSGATPIDPGDCPDTAQDCSADARPFIDTGIASWYGPGFHGRKTASGEVFDQNAMTAAHKTLPLGTRVRVVRIEDGRSVEVDINDRGPFIDGRVIDLSRRAAERLGMKEEGIVPVRVFVVGDPPLLIADNDALPAPVGADPEPAPLPVTDVLLVAETPADDAGDEDMAEAETTVLP
ncbi:septal ring lytic transglycosylase RlpA family protein [Azospirillum halopraeferens]|uniref:septal ring lytic transglycosylase RlpA family protein n=1 Tax=Azospirillum halopraeferens TaxID=34010 RepID=UPI000412FEDB|nr:septal ring lytic transglycosylase RlpA family protein [Azospirillum halopraeferens]